MTNPYDPVVASEHSIPSGQGGTIPANWNHKGLTKREYFAAMAMTAAYMYGSDGGNYRGDAVQDLAKSCVAYADALILELNKANGPSHQ